MYLLAGATIAKQLKAAYTRTRWPATGGDSMRMPDFAGNRTSNIVNAGEWNPCLGL
jgi:hypothetical protein